MPVIHSNPFNPTAPEYHTPVYIHQGYNCLACIPHYSEVLSENLSKCFDRSFHCQSCIYKGLKFCHEWASMCPSTWRCQVISSHNAGYKVDYMITVIHSNPVILLHQLTFITAIISLTSLSHYSQVPLESSKISKIISVDPSKCMSCLYPTSKFHSLKKLLKKDKYIWLGICHHCACIWHTT